MKGKKFRLLLTMLLFTQVFFLPASGQEDSRKQQDSKPLTLMIYMCGSDLEGRNGAATMDLMEMTDSGFDDTQVNVLVMAGGTKRWLNRFSTDETSIWEVHADGTILAKENPQLNMGDQQTLAQLLEYGYEYYPAEKYALILWDHGGGPLSGVCWDMLADKDNLSMPELEEALAGSPFSEKGLEWIGFDACLMSSVEVAHALMPYAGYMIASQETEPGSGWSYSFLKGIEEDESGADTGRRIIEHYFDDAENAKADLTLSCMDLSKTQQVDEGMDAFFSDLAADLDTDTFSELSNMRQRTRGFGRAAGSSGNDAEGDAAENDRDLADLTDLVRHYAPLSPGKAEELVEALDEMIVCSRSNIKNSSGLSVYHPCYNKTQFREKWEDAYRSLHFSTGYMEYLQEFTGIWLGEQLGDWKVLLMPEEEAPSQGQDMFSVMLTPEQIDSYAYAQLVVLEKWGDSPEDGSAGDDADTDGSGDTGEAAHGTGIYTQVYITDDVTSDEDGKLSSYYTGQTLYAVNGNGDPICGPLHYQMVDGRIRIYANYISRERNEVVHALFICTGNETGEADGTGAAGGELTVSSVQIYDEATENYSNRLTLDEEEFDEISFPMNFRMETYGEDGELLPFDQWEEAPTLVAQVLYLPQEWHFSFSKEQLSSSELYASFQITDTQANRHGTPLVPVVNKKIRDMELAGADIEEADYTLRFSGSLMETDIGAGMILALEADNRTGSDLDIWVPDGLILVNGNVPAYANEEINTAVPPGKTQELKLTFGSDALKGIESISSILMPVSVNGEMRNVMLESDGLSLQAVTHADGDSPVYAETSDAGGARWELLDLDYNSAFYVKGLTGTVHCENTADTALNCSFTRAVADGIELKLHTDLNISLQPGQERYIDLLIENERFLNGGFKLAGGRRSLTEPDVLGQAGISQLHHITLVGKDSDDNTVKVEFTLEEPFTPDKDTETDQAETQRSERIKMFEAGGLSMFITRAWVIDDGILLVLDVENSSSEDMRYLIQGPKLNGMEAFEYSWGNPEDAALVCAGSLARRYLQLSPYAGKDEMTFLESAGITVSLDDEELSGMSSVDISLPAKPELNLPGGVFLEPDQMEVQTTLSASSGNPLIAHEITLPENAAQYRVELSVRPDEAGEWQAGKKVDNVLALIVRRFEETEKFIRKDGTPASGEILGTLAQVELREREDGSFAGFYTGLVPMYGDSFISSFMVREKGEDADTLLLSQLNADYGTDVFAKEEYISGFAIVSLKFDILLDYTDNTAVTENYSVTDFLDPGRDYTNWPAERFDFTGNTSRASEYTEENGKLVRGEDTWILDNGTIYFDGRSLQLSLVPIEAFEEEIQVLYFINYEDGSQEIVRKMW